MGWAQKGLLSIAACLLFGAGAANAGCLPVADTNTPPPGTTVTCGGTVNNQNNPNGYGLGSQSGLTIDVQSGASVTGGAGMNLDDNNVVNNSGTITGTQSGANGGGGILAQHGITVNNLSGATISATGIDSDAIKTFDSAAAVTVTNAGTISVSDLGAAIEGGIVTVTNTGNISATGPKNSFGILASSGSVINSGTISGQSAAIGLGGASSSIFNSGTIINPTPGGTAISLGPQPSTLTLGPGSVIVGLVVAAGDEGTLQLGGTGSATFDQSAIGLLQQYSGFNTFNKIGDSTWTLTGTGDLLGTGNESWNVESGTLVVGGDSSPGALIIGSAIVNAGGTLRGHGTINGNLTNIGGTVFPGASIGTLTVNGNYVQEGGTFMAEVSPTEASRLNVGGTASLGQAALALGFDPGTYAPASFTLIHSAGLTGQFSSISETGLLPLRDFSVGTTPTDAILTIFPSAIAQTVPVTPNQSSLTTVLNQAFGNATGGDLLTVHDTLLGLGITQQRQALNQADGTVYTDQPGVVTRQAQQANGTAIARVFPGEESEPIGDQAGIPVPVTPNTEEENPPDGLWLQGGADWGSVNGDGNAPGFSTRGGNAIGGYDHLFDDGIRVGLALGYDHTDIGEQNDGAAIAVDTYRSVAYSGFNLGPIVLGGALDFGVDRASADRPIALGGASRTATASPMGRETSGTAKIGYPLSIAGMTLTPSFSVDYIHLNQSGFTEAGANSLNLNVAPNHYNSLQPTFDLRLKRVFKLDNGMLITPEAHFGLSYETLDNSVTNAAVLASTPSAGTFTTQGVALDRTVGQIGGKIVVRVRNTYDLYAYFDSEISGNQHAESGRFGVKYHF